MIPEKPITIGRYMTAEPQPGADGWVVKSRRPDATLGTIEWYARWRSYEFMPYYGARFTSDCLMPLADFLRDQTDARRRKVAGGVA